MEPKNYDDPKLLDTLLFSLDNIVIQKAKEFTETERVDNLGVRVINPNTSHDNELKARQIILDYVADPNFRERLAPQHNKIMQIYNRLVDLSSDEEQWIEGIGKETIIACAPTISTKMLFHIHADEFGSSSSLEGELSKNAVTYLLNFLSQSPKLTYSEGLLEELNNAIFVSADMQTFMSEIREKISEAFETGKPLLLTGGWTGVPSGHAIYYEIIPNSDNTASFRLYNTGAGVADHLSKLEGHKVKYHAYGEWRGIDREKLEAHRFLEAMHELQSQVILPTKNEYESKVSTAYEEKDIYAGLKALLEPKSEIEGLEQELVPSTFMSIQRSGVCAWKSLMAFMRTKMEMNQYKRFKSEIKLQSLLDWIEASSSEVNLTDWRLIKKSHQNLSRSITKLYQQGIVDADYIQKVEGILRHVEKWIFLHRDIRYIRAENKISSTYAPSVKQYNSIQNTHAFPEALGKMIGDDSSIETSAIQQPLKISLKVFHEINEIASKDPIDALERILTEASLCWQQGNDTVLYKGLIDFITNLSLDESFWNSIVTENQEVAEKLIIQLGELTQFFIKTCFTIPQAHIIFSEKIYFLCKIMHIQETLCHNAFPKLANLKLMEQKFLEKLHFISKDNFFLYFSNAIMHNEMNKMSISKIPSYKHMHIISTPMSKDIELKCEFGKPFLGNEETVFYFLREKYSEVIAKIQQENPGIMELPVHCQNAHIYANSALPEWLKAIRDTQITFHYITSCPVVPLESFDREKKLSPHFHIKEENEKYSEGKKSIVTINLTEVDKSILDVPQVKKIIKEPYLRFSQQYRGLGTPSIREFFYLLISNFRSMNEKGLINYDVNKYLKHKSDFNMPSLSIPKNMKGTHLTDEEFRKFARVFLNPNLQHIETLEYFIQFPERLKSPDYQLLFHVLLFKGLLEKNQAIEGFGNRLAYLIQKSYKLFNEENVIQPTAFLLRLSEQLQPFFPEEQFLGDTSEKLKALLLRKGINEDDKALLFSELIAALGHQKTLSEEDVALLISGSIYVEENQSESKCKLDPSAIKEGREALLIHAERINEVLVQRDPNNQLLNQILTVLRPNIRGDKKWVVKNEADGALVFETEDSLYTLYPSLSRLISKETLTLLPLNIRENALFVQLFPGISKGLIHSKNIFFFEDSHGYETLVSLNDGKLIVEQKQEDNWFRYIPSSLFLERKMDWKTRKETVESLIGSRDIIQNYNHWQLLENNPENLASIYCIDRKSGELHFLINAKLIKNPFRNNSESIELIEIFDVQENLLLGKSSYFLTCFEDVGYIHEWYDLDRNLQKIDLPRFNLTFSRSQEYPKKLICNQFPGYFFNIEESEKKLGVHSHYILLENERGKRKLLLPNVSLKAPEKMESLKPEYDLDRTLDSTEKNSQSYYAYEIKKSKLVSKSREANLYLAEVLTASQEYKRAASYLKRYGSKLGLYSERESEIVKALAQMGHITGDTSGNGTVLQLYAAYLYVKNSLSNHQEPSDVNIESLQNLYDRYIDRHRNVTVFKLKSSEEIFLLKSFLNRGFDVKYFMRLKELDPISAEKVETPPQSKSKVNRVLTLEDFDIPFDYSDNPSSKPFQGLSLLTRPQRELKNHFLYFYDIARGKKDPEKKQRLKDSLHFLRNIAGKRNAGMANFFEAVLENPAIFPDPLSSYSNVSIKEWKETLRTLAEEVLAKKFEESAIQASASRQSPENFYLEKKVALVEPLKFKGNLLNVPQLSIDSREYFEEKVQKEEADVAELTKILGSFKSVDPVHKKEMTRLADDLKAYKDQPTATSYTLKENNFEKVRKSVLKDKQADKSTLRDLEEEILLLANRRSDSKVIAAELQLMEWGELLKVITLEELIVNFARNDFSNLFERNPVLEEKDINLLAEKVGNYLLIATRSQQRKRAEIVLRKLEKSKPEDRDDLINQLGETLLATRHYNPAEKPAYLAFDYFADISMRLSQVQKLEKFLNGGEQNLVLEMIMGSGKSKVLLPLLALLRADGENLSMIIVPQPLFESVSQDTQAALLAFSQSMHSLSFDRDTKFTKEYLEIIHDDLNTVINNRECLIMTSKSLQCLILKFVEESALHFQRVGEGEAFSEELKLMQKILGLLSKNGYPIIDEADTVLNVLHEVSFSTGRVVFPKKVETETLTEIFSLIYDDLDLKSLARLESDPNANKDAPVFTEQLYFETIQPCIVSKFIERLGHISFDSQKLTNKIHRFIEGLNEQDRQNLYNYLSRKKKEIPSAQEFFDTLDLDVKGVIAFAGEQFSRLLPFTLAHVYNEKYGFDGSSNNFLALPYSASQTPSIGSFFSNPHITMNYTFQAYMKKGFTINVLESHIKHLQEKALEEVHESGGIKLPIDTKAGKAFIRLRGSVDIPFFNYTPEDLDKLLESVNSSSDAKRFIASSIILTSLEQFELKMSCNPLNLVSFFLKASGFTGTLWNENSMHPMLKPNREIGIDAKTLVLLAKNSSADILTIKEGSVIDMLEQLKEKSVAFDMIGDAGGYFKEGTNTEMAHKIAAFQGIEVVFYNAKGEQQITNGSKEISLSESNKLPEERLTFLDQSHTTGADVPQKRDAVSLVTIGHKMLLRDLLQSVWRLRGLEKSQRVRFVLSEEVSEIIRQKLNLTKEAPIEFETILHFVILNQAEQQGRDNYKALKDGLDAILQKVFLEVLLDETISSSERKHVFDHLNSAWIHSASFDSAELYGTLTTEMDSDKVVELEKQLCISRIKDFFGKVKGLEAIGIIEEKCLDEVDIIVSKMKETLYAKIAVSGKNINLDGTTETEREIKNETEQEVELEVREAASKEKVLLHRIEGESLREFPSFSEAVKLLTKAQRGTTDSFPNSKCPYFPLESYMITDSDLESYASAFEGINIAFNVLEWTNKDDVYSLLGYNRVDFHHILIQEDSKVTLLTQEEAGSFFDKPEYYNITFGFINPEKKPTEEALLKIVKLKFLNGNSYFDKQELKLLRKWFEEQGVERMRALYTQHILRGYPNKAERYRNSSLEKLFKKMSLLT